MKVCLSEEDQRKQLVNEFDYNVLVEAGAGSGKTTIIINRIINQLISTEAAISQIVAITFTNKAANELKERLQKELSLKVKDKSVDEEKRYKLAQALENVDKMHISTIHSFCNSMLSERPFDANLSLGFKFVEETESNEIKRKVFEDYMKNRTREENDKIQNFGVSGSKLIDSFLNLADKRNIDIMYDKESLNEKIESIYEEINKLLNKTFETIVEYKKDNSELKYLKKYIKENINEYEKILKEIPDIKIINIANQFLNEGIGTNNTKLGKKINEWFDRHIRDNLEKYINKFEIFKHAVLTEFIIKIIDRYDDVKKEGKIVTNDDLLYLSKEMVKNSPSARNFFQNKYKVFYIDEFQDTDPIQTELFFYLASQSCEKSFWNNKLKPGSLFLVGDPKQSIYGFRGADIEIYNKVKYTFEEYELANAKVYTLIMNYRSTDTLCQWIENTFKMKDVKESKFGFPDKSDETNNQAVFDGIKSGVDLNKIIENQKSDYLNGIYEYDINSMVEASDKNSRGINNDTVIKYDAKYIADIIYKMVNNKMQLMDKTISYDDFLIITWDASNNKMDKYVEALEEKGIPVNLQGKVKVDRLNEINKLVELLKYLNNPYDRVQFGIVLSKNFNIAIEDIDWEKINNKVFGENSMSLPYRSVWLDNIDEIEDEEIKRVIKLLKELINEKYKIEPIQYIENIINKHFDLLKDEGEYDSIRINSCFASLMQFVESLRNVEYSNFNNIVEIINDKLEEVNKREMSINHKNNQSVRIMNLHQAKGLEGNIVILACPSKRSIKEVYSYVSRSEISMKGYYCINSASQFGLTSIAKPWKLAECFPNDKVKSFHNKAKDNNEKEFTRLNYVAATRAQKVLIISRNSDGKDEKNWDKLLKGSELPKIEECSKYNNEAHKIIDITSKIVKRTEEVTKVKEKVQRKTYKILSPSELNKKAGNNNKIEKTNRPYGKEFGTMIHRMFELIVDNRSDIFFGNYASKKAEKIESIIKLSIYETARDIEITERVIKEIYLDENIKNMSKNEAISSMYKSLHDVFLECAHRFVNDNNIRYFLQNAKKVYTELPFSIFLDRTEDENFNNLLAEHYDKKTEEIKENKIWINGVMDLVIENNDSTYTILDYKTTRPGKDEEYDKFMDDLLKKYLGQLNMYKYVLNKMLGKDVEVNNLAVYSFEEDGNVVEVDKKEIH